MKEITKMSRLTGSLERIFRLINEHYFNGELEMPVITVQSTPRAYGHYSVSKIWTINGEETRHEINLGAGTLDRDIEFTVATLIHECVHYWNDTVANVQDTSRGNSYHNKYFKATAERVGLIVTKSEKYGWAHTGPSDETIQFILDNDIQEIKLNRNEPGGVRITGGNNTGNATGQTPGKNPNSHSIKYACPSCGNSVRATKKVNIICADCMQLMIEA